MYMLAVLNITIKIIILGAPVVAQQKRIRLVPMRLRVRSLASLSGLRIQCCRELWYRSQTRLGSCVVVAVVSASSCSSNWTPSLGSSICHRCSPKKQKQKQKQNKTKKKPHNKIIILEHLTTMPIQIKSLENVAMTMCT